MIIGNLAMRRKNELITISIFIALILVFSLVNSYWDSLPYANYKIGDEIKGFPVDGISMTITNFSISQTNLPFPNSSMIVLNVTIHNLADKAVYFNQSGFQTKFEQAAASKHLELTFRTTSGGGGSAYPNNYNDWWGITVFGGPEFNSLTANENIGGSILYVLTPDSYISFELVCKSTSQQKPLFNVNLAQG